MKKQSNQLAKQNNTRKTAWGYKSVLAILTLLIIAVSSIIIWNATNLQLAIERRTKVYVSDVSLQLSKDIDYRLQKALTDLELLEDSLWRENNENLNALHEFLNRKADILDFTSIVLVDSDGSCYATQALDEEVYNLPGIQSSLKGEKCVTVLKGQDILYSIPIYRDEKVVGVLGGVRNQENMQKLIAPHSFSGKGLTCIVDINGKVIISPKNLEPFLRLEDIFMEQSGDKQNTIMDIQQMQEDIKHQKSGIFSFTAVDGMELILSYDPLKSSDWTLLTLVSADLISNKTDSYISQTFIIITGVILLFLIILSVLYKTYRRHYQQMQQLAFTDNLTGAMNNSAFQLRCSELLKSAPPSTYAVVSLNIKDFKLINEGFGSTEGNLTLRYIMRVLSKHVSREELAARAKADHFFLCLKENEPSIIRERLQDIIADINSFNSEATEPYYLTIQPGVYVIDDPSLEITVIQDRANTACHDRSPVQDGDCIFYDTAVTKRMQKERELSNLFEPSLKNGDFKMYLQPKLRLQSGRVGGAEALVRWQHPQRGMIFPSDFIPLFEKNGKICKLDLFIFEEACKMLRRWLDAGATPFPISVNISRQHFQNSDFLNRFYAISQKYQIPEGLLEMELTESIFFDDQRIETVKAQISRMHELGFRCSLDDFGAGYSSLGLLMEFDVDVIKLDRRFFHDIKKTKAQKVILSVMKLSKEIGTSVVAEGIEDAFQLGFLKSCGCDLVQGYVFSKPLPIDEFEQWLKQQTKEGKSF